VAAALRAVGLAEDPRFGADHRVLSRAGYPRTGGDAAAAGAAAAGAGGGPAGAGGCAGSAAAGRDAGAAAGQADRLQGAVPRCGAVAGAAGGDLRGGAVAGAGGAGAAAVVPAAGYPLGVLFGLFSIVALSAHVLHPDQLPARAAAWYAKDEPTFADALAAVRRALWAAGTSRTQADPTDSPLSPRDSLASLMDAAAYAA